MRAPTPVRSWPVRVSGRGQEVVSVAHCGLKGGAGKDEEVTAAALAHGGGGPPDAFLRQRNGSFSAVPLAACDGAATGQEEFASSVVIDPINERPLPRDSSADSRGQLG
jgi:hypothetical protein